MNLSKIKKITIHYVGNKLNEENIRLTQIPLQINNEIADILQQYFLVPFKSQEYYNLFHETDLSLNEVYSYVSNIFDNPEIIMEQSINLAKHLYEQSVHPKIKGGEFYTVLFNNCTINDETVDAVGLFKSENKETFLKVYPSGEGYGIESDNGININKLDKGCLIFNTEKENGYIVAIVDNTNKGADAQYWIDDFLHVQQRKDNYYDTQNFMSFAKQFIKEELPQKFAVSKADQIDLLNKSVKFFKEKDVFNLGEFTNDVIEKPAVIERFNDYKSEYAKDFDLEFSESFPISDSAVKKQSKIFKSIIKLDKNFHIYIHGDRNMIEQGEDRKGKFYKVYYNEEN